MSKLNSGEMYEPKTVGRKINDILDGVESNDQDTMRMLRVSVSAFRFAKATGVDASSAETAMAITPTDGQGAIPAGSLVLAVQTANTTHPFLLSTAYRPTTLAVNSVNCLTTNFAGQAMGLIIANRAAL